MIDLTHLSSSLASHPDNARTVKLIGIGGAGSNIMDRLVLDGFDKALLSVANTDVQSLTASVAGHKIHLGRETTRGLGAGGDPELGRAAAEESADAIREAISGSSMVLMCTGLGGGTGSGAAPFIAELVREQNALGIVLATMPFSFEGRRRRAQAEEAVEALRQMADLVIVFENDRMGEASPVGSGISHAFATTDQILSQCLSSVSQIFQKPGMLRIGFDEFSNVVRDGHNCCIFGLGEADGDNRAHDAVARALKSPLMDRGKLLDQSPAILVNICGGPGMSLQDAETVMSDLAKHIEDHTLVHLGVTVDAKAGTKLSVMILGGLGQNAPAVPIKTRVQTKPVQQVKPEFHHEEPEISHPAPEEAPEEVVPDEIPVVTLEAEPQEIIPEPEAAIESAQPELVPAVAPPLPKPQRSPRSATPAEPQKPAAPRKVEPVQETLPFEPVSRGRFDKSEPTIIDGEDLDVPTFLRRNVKVK